MPNSDVEELNTSIRLHPRHIAGIEVAIDRRRQQGYQSISRSAIVREALDRYFKLEKIRLRDIKAKIAETQAE